MDIFGARKYLHTLIPCYLYVRTAWSSSSAVHSSSAINVSLSCKRCWYWICLAEHSSQSGLDFKKRTRFVGCEMNFISILHSVGLIIGERISVHAMLTVGDLSIIILAGGFDFSQAAAFKYEMLFTTWLLY